MLFTEILRPVAQIGERKITRSSKSPPTSHSDATVLSSVQVTKAVWTPEDETALINFLVQHKAEAGDDANFQTAIWNAAAQEMIKHTAKGGAKTAEACKTKWARVGTRSSSPMCS